MVPGIRAWVGGGKSKRGQSGSHVLVVLPHFRNEANKAPVLIAKKVAVSLGERQFAHMGGDQRYLIGLQSLGNIKRESGRLKRGLYRQVKNLMDEKGVVIRVQEKPGGLGIACLCVLLFLTGVAHREEIVGGDAEMWIVRLGQVMI